MKFAALISGGKDSCFNMMACIAEGHEIVALANLRPDSKGLDELDSYMYQTVGHHAIDLYAEAMELPLYVRTIQGSGLNIGRDYLPQEGDEVEDLFQLLSQIKAEKNIEAVSVGAILSDYQRVRVENVCQRLSLKVFAFLWRRNQEELLKEMIACDLKAIIIKVAALGLLPDKHLGMELKEILPHMLKMKEKYGLNECGEGGEYETFVFDCPLFKKSIVIEEKELVIHSDDAFAPVGYLNLRKCHLQEKPQHGASSFVQNVENLPMTTTAKWLARQQASVEDNDSHHDAHPEATTDAHSSCPILPLSGEPCPSSASDGVHFAVAGIKAVVASDADVSSAADTAMASLKDCIEELGHEMSSLTSVSVYIQDMANYSHINASYIKHFGINPPVRICIQACLPPNVVFQLDCQGEKRDESNFENDRRTMHVQSLSHWAPANIGPFSQTILTRGKLFVAGTTALVPSNLQLIDGGIGLQSKVALDHVLEKLEALWPRCTLAHCPLVNCYVTKKENIPVARKTFDQCLRQSKQRFVSLSPSVQCCVVPRLPKGASVEWQVYGWTFEDSDEDDIQGLQFKKEFPLYTVAFDCSWFQDYFSCRIEVCCSASERVDMKQLAGHLMEEYAGVLASRDRVIGQGLAKIFYPACRCSEKELIESFTGRLPNVVMEKMPTFSFVPVISLEREEQLLVWCQ